MRIDTDPRLPAGGATAPGFMARLYDLFRLIAQQLNALSEGSIVAAHNASAAPPTTGAWQQGDVIRNRLPTELGTAGARYVVTGWICTASGSPGTWREMRALTGN